MPIIKKNGKVGYFAHIPKCGGSSIEHYCKQIGANLAFVDTQFVSHPAAQPWNISSPQHIDGQSLSRLFPAEFFDFSFAVVRNPVERFISAFKFQLLVENTIAADRNINEFIAEDLASISITLGQFDNHFMPQSVFLMPNLEYKLFRFEEGFSKVKWYIDHRFLGTAAKVNMQHKNKGRDTESLDEQLKLTTSSLALLKEIYQADYEKFGFID